MVSALVLTGALWSGFVHVARALELNGHCMAIGINSDGTPIRARMHFMGIYFLTEDEEAYVWMNITLDERVNIRAQWGFRKGAIYQVDEKTCGEGSQYVWFSLSIKDRPPAQAPKWWEVKVFADDTLLFFEDFEILQAPTFPWTTFLPIVGVVVAAIAAPILLVFSKMKSPPPKLGFALSLVGGLMVAISGFFRGALGGSTFVLDTGAWVFILMFLLIVPIFLGAAISVSILTRKRALVLFLSISSLIYSVLFYSAPVSGDVRVWVLPFVLAATGSVFGILSGLLISVRASIAIDSIQLE